MIEVFEIRFPILFGEFLKCQSQIWDYWNCNRMNGTILP